MEMSAQYRYLNAGGRWPEFKTSGLEFDEDGAARLAALPAPREALPADLAERARPAVPAGLAIGPDGERFWSVPETDRLWSSGACRTNPTALECLGGSGDEPTRFHSPRGVLFHLPQHRLYVADAGNHRVQVFDARTRQLTAIWERGFEEPGALARDSAGYVYVADPKKGRVGKYDADGHRVLDFALGHPTAVAVRGAGKFEQVYVLDASTNSVSIYATDGASIATFKLEGDIVPMGLAVSDADDVFVGDNKNLRIRKYSADRDEAHVLMGEAHYHGPVAALALDGCGGLLVLPGGGPPIRLALDAGCRSSGGLWSGTFTGPPLTTASWHRLKALVQIPDGGAAIQLYVRKEMSDVLVKSIVPPWSELDKVRDLAVLQRVPPSGSPAPNGVWYRAPRGATECLFPALPGERVCVAVESTSDGKASPVVEQLRIDYQFEGLVRRLPDCFADDAPAGGFTSRFVGLFASIQDDAGAAIDRLPARFDPAAANSEALADLAALVGLEPHDDTPELRLRDDVAQAFDRHSQRGTAAGLVRTIRRELGIWSNVEEPIRQARVWILPADGADPIDVDRGVGSMLGVNTALASSEPQGAVVGSTLALDRTALLSNEDLGRPLFGDLAHRIVVRVPACPSAGPEYLRKIEALLDREVPCHVNYAVCPVEPRMRLGFQARLEIDAVLGGPAGPAPVGEHTDKLILAGAVGTIGVDARLGQTAFLGSDAVDSSHPAEIRP